MLYIVWDTDSAKAVKADALYSLKTASSAKRLQQLLSRPEVTLRTQRLFAYVM
jgi:hypothetical protein